MLKGLLLAALGVFLKRSLSCELHVIASGPWAVRTQTLPCLLTLPSCLFLTSIWWSGHFAGRSGPSQGPSVQSQLSQFQDCVSCRYITENAGLSCPLHAHSTSLRSLICSLFPTAVGLERRKKYNLGPLYAYSPNGRQQSWLSWNVMSQVTEA